MAFVKARLALDSHSDGDRLSLVYEDIPANAPLQRSVADLGHKIHAVKHIPQSALAEKTQSPTPTNSYPEAVELIQMIVEVKKNRS